MTQVVLTGGSGKLGRACLSELLEHGYAVTNVDLVRPAARHLGIRTIVSASSETVLGLPFSTPPPYVPVDEEYAPRPETAYALSKTVGEEMARHFCRWDPELKIITLRFSNVMLAEEYARFPGFEDDPASRKWNLWSYIDARDAAQAVRKGLEAPLTGAEVFIIASPDTVMTTPVTELVARFFPGVPWRREVEPHESMFDTAKARRLLGFEPKYSWRAEIGRDETGG